MRQFQYTGKDALVVPAAHSRRIEPGAVVDFDEVITPRQGALYSLEVAVGAAAAAFVPVESKPAGSARRRVHG